MRTNAHSSFYKNALWQYGLQFVKHLLPLITIPYLTRVLEPSGYAIYAYVLAFMQFMQVLIDFGFNLSGTKRIAESQNVNETNLVIGRITAARLMLCGGGLAATVVAIFVVPLLRQNAFYTVLAYIAVCGRGLAPDFLFQGKEKMGPLTTRYLVSKGTSTLLTFMLVRSFADILWIPLLDILASTIALAWSFSTARRMFGTTIAFPSLASSIAELKVSALYFVSNMASSTFSGFTTLVIGVVLTNAAEVSYWSLAMTGITAVQTLFTPITNSLYPRMVVSGDYGFARKLGLFAAPVLLVGTVAYMLLADTLVLILGGGAYLPGSYVFIATAAVIPLSYYGMSFGWPVLGAAGHVRTMVLSTIVAGVFNIVLLLSIWCLGWMSLLAVSIVRVATEAVLAVLRLTVCWKTGLLNKGAKR